MTEEIKNNDEAENQSEASPADGEDNNVVAEGDVVAVSDVAESEPVVAKAESEPVVAKMVDNADKSGSEVEEKVSAAKDEVKTGEAAVGAASDDKGQKPASARPPGVKVASDNRGTQRKQYPQRNQQRPQRPYQQRTQRFKKRGCRFCLDEKIEIQE